MRGLDFELKLPLLFRDWLLLFWSASLVMMDTPAELVEWKETTQGTKQSEESRNESHSGFGRPGFRAHESHSTFGQRENILKETFHKKQITVATRHSCNPYIAAMCACLPAVQGADK